MKKIIVLAVLILLHNCAPHGHVYKLINNDNDTVPNVGVSIVCQINNKTFLVQTKEVDSIILCSKTFGEKKCVDVKKGDSLIKYPHYKFIINDKRFHKLFNLDTLELKIKDKSEWHELYYKAIPDNHSTQ